MLDFMVNHSYFFFLWPGIHGLLFEFWVVFTKMLAEKFDTLVVFMKCKKKNWNHLVPRMGPRAYFRLRRAAAPAAGASRFHRGLRRCAAEAKNALGPILGTRWFQFILFLHFMKPQKFQIFCQHFCETTQNSNNYPWNQVTKKNEWFPIKTCFSIVCLYYW